ncbi:glycosyltransferase [Rufibacter glacialis]|uniref:Glycosyltransferase n=1 Tax=Rufibacter glacialis TaxID=1259555 RepID=A0A5M8QRJ3_9BACT|nr:glycosyltransferase [Rufibacter glacialis]KAA6437614.1 glycosyltransferase [Rufibacter glacialis]GGK57800.1 glycosyl transferase [Rufibacter glacialis]
MSQEKKKNILLLIPNVGFGGAERVFNDHSIAFGKKYNVIECVFNTDGKKAYSSGNKLINLDVPGGGSLFEKVKNFIVRCQKLKKVKRQYEVDICISHLEGADYINLLSKGAEKVILCIHGSKLHDKNITGAFGFMRKKILMPSLYNRADKIVTVSRDINPELIYEFRVKSDKVITINNFFNIEEIQSKASEPLEPTYSELFQRGDILITSGRLATQKNQKPIFSILSEVKKYKPESKLIIIGDGELRTDLVEEGKRCGLNLYQAWNNDLFNNSYDVYFLGYQANPFKYLSKASAFVFPSAWEGFPMALCEAMICGLPVISADCPTGPREILSPLFQPEHPIRNAEFSEYGVLMPMLSSSDITEAKAVWVDTLIKILDNSSLRVSYSRKGIERTSALAPDKIIHKWEEVIENV